MIIKSNSTKSVRGEHLLPADLFLAWCFQVLFALHILLMTNALQIEPDSSCIGFDKIWIYQCFLLSFLQILKIQKARQLKQYLQ